MIIKGWTVRGVVEEEGGKLEEKDFTAEFSSDEFVSLVMKRKFEQIQDRASNVKKVEKKLGEFRDELRNEKEDASKIEPKDLDKTT